jgi:hypothetical protein
MAVTGHCDVNVILVATIQRIAGTVEERARE